MPLESPRMVSERYSEEFYWGGRGASREFFDGVHVRWRLNCSLLHFVGRFYLTHVCYSLAGRSVLGETVPEVLSTARGRRPRAVLRPRAQFLPIRTDLGRWITFLFFSYWYLKVSERDKVWDRELTMFSNFSNLQRGHLTREDMMLTKIPLTGESVKFVGIMSIQEKFIAYIPE